MQELAPKAWQYGVLGVVALAFALAIIHLWKTLREDTKTRAKLDEGHANERAEWAARELRLRHELATKEADLRSEYERKHREVVDNYAQLAKAERRESREHEDRVREEFSEIIDKIREDANKASDETINILQKFYDRFVGPKRGVY